MSSFKEREPAVFGGLTVVLLVLWVGFLVHRSPAFPGSLIGHSLGVIGAALILVPLLYLVIKRVAWIRRAVTRRWPIRTLLAWHIYAGILGPILVILHTGHHFESPLGIALTTATLVAAVSGFTGRFLMKRVNTGLRELRGQLEQIRVGAGDISAELNQAHVAGDPLRGRSFLSALWSAFFIGDAELAPSGHLVRRAVRLAEAQADVEYALATHELFKALFSKWLRVHIVISAVLWVLLGLHVWATIHFGLRWLT